MSYRVKIWKERADSAAAAAREVTEKAARENRPMTAAEDTTYKESMAQLQDCLTAIKAARADEDSMTAIKAAVGGIGGPQGSGPAGRDTGRRLSFKGGGMAAAVANRMVVGDLSEKTLAPSGAAVVAQSFDGDPVALGRVATGLLDVLPVVMQSSPQYAYLAQTSRSNNAAIVEEGTEKPTSSLGLVRVDKELQVIAHLSDPIARYWLLDSGALETFVSSELEYGLGLAVESMVVDEINATSGIQTQAFSTSALQTIRKSVTRLEVAGHAPAAIVLHPSDWEGVELALSSTNAVEHLSLPYDPAGRRLYGVPVAVSVSATPGTGHIVGQGAVAVDTDTIGVQVQWSENVGDSFAFNQIVARCEGRYGVSVYAPLGVVVASLAASGGASGASGASG